MRIHPTLTPAVLGLLAVAGCNDGAEQAANTTTITVRSAKQDQLHQLNAMNLAIGLKRAIYTAGFTCKRVTDAGFVGKYENLDMWTARCVDGEQSRDWAIFAGPDGSAQVRDCKDVASGGLPKCEITRRPKGQFG